MYVYEYEDIKTCKLDRIFKLSKIIFKFSAYSFKTIVKYKTS